MDEPKYCLLALDSSFFFFRLLCYGIYLLPSSFFFFTIETTTDDTAPTQRHESNPTHHPYHHLLPYCARTHAGACRDRPLHIYIQTGGGPCALRMCVRGWDPLWTVVGSFYFTLSFCLGEGEGEGGVEVEVEVRVGVGVGLVNV
jgi:hypothetical protein